MEKEKPFIGHSVWTKVTNPLYEVECPHCGAIIFMSTPKFIEKLKKWAKQKKQD